MDSYQDFERICHELLENNSYYPVVSSLLYLFIGDIDYDVATQCLKKILSEYATLSKTELRPRLPDMLQNLNCCLWLLIRDPYNYYFTTEICDELSSIFLQYVGLCLDAGPSMKERARLRTLTRPFVEYFPLFARRYSSPLHSAIRLLWRFDTFIRKYVIADHIVKFLADCGADVDARDVYGNAPLHLIARCREDVASRTCIVKITEALLRRGASPDCRNGRGETPMDLAVLREVRSTLWRYNTPRYNEIDIIIEDSDSMGDCQSDTTDNSMGMYKNPNYRQGACRRGGRTSAMRRFPRYVTICT